MDYSQYYIDNILKEDILLAMIQEIKHAER